MAESITKTTIDGEVAFPSEYVAAIDLRGKDWTVTLTDLKREMVFLRAKGKKEQCNIFSMKGTPKKFICNKTNAGTMADIYGNTELRSMVGKKVTIYPTKCRAKSGGMVDCIRIRDTRPKQAPEPEPDFGEPEPRPMDFNPDADDAPDHVTAALDHLDPPGTTQRLAGLPGTATGQPGGGGGSVTGRPMTESEKAAIREQEMRDAEAERQRLFK